MNLIPRTSRLLLVLYVRYADREVRHGVMQLCGLDVHSADRRTMATNTSMWSPLFPSTTWSTCRRKGGVITWMCQYAWYTMPVLVFFTHANAAVISHRMFNCARTTFCHHSLNTGDRLPVSPPSVLTPTVWISSIHRLFLRRAICTFTCLFSHSHTHCMPHGNMARRTIPIYRM